MIGKQLSYITENIEPKEAPEAIALIKVFGNIADMILTYSNIDINITGKLAWIIKDGADTYIQANTHMYLIKPQEEK